MIDKEVIKRTVNHILALSYGDTISHAALAEQLGIGYKSPEYRAGVHKVQKECLEQGKMLENVFRVGYRVTYPGDYSGRTVREFKMGAKRFAKGAKILDCAPVSDMAPDELNEYRRISDRVKVLNASMTGAVVELKLLRRDHPLLPSAR